MKELNKQAHISHTEVGDGHNNANKNNLAAIDCSVDISLVVFIWA